MVPSPQPAFAEIAARLKRDPRVQERTGFSTDPGLRADGKVFAIVQDGELVLRLPRERVAQLVRVQAGRHRYNGPQPPLREWVSIPQNPEVSWLELTKEAHAYALIG